jgi:outer membrane protein TolC
MALLAHRLPAGEATETSAAGKPLVLTVAQSVAMAFENNISFRAERLQPPIQKEYEEVERAVFDPRLAAAVAAEDVSGDNDGHTVEAEAGVSQYFATGTTAEVVASADDAKDDGDTERTASLDVQVTQALLRDRGREANLVRLRQAVIDTRVSQHELRAVAETLLAGVELAYWECVLAREKIGIYTRSLAVAEQQIKEVREKIGVGKLAELELAASEAEVASKREQLITARGDLAKRLLDFRRLVNPNGGQWTRELSLLDPPEQPDVVLDDVAAHVQLGLRNRPDLLQAQLQVSRGELDVVGTRNGLLPRLDLFVRLGGTHYAESFSDLDRNHDVRATVGLTMDLPFGLREEKARHRIATLSLEQTEMALTNMKQLVQYDVRAAYVAVGVAREQIVATAATRKLRQDTLTAEQEKFRVGTSTTLQVAQAWRDLTASQINEVEAVIGLRKAMIVLYRLEGTLLSRRGIEVAAPDRRD